MLPLLVALFNLLVAGYAMAAARGDRSRLAFAFGPAGVGIWAVAWFVSLFDPGSLQAMRLVGTIGGLVAISGFAADALRELSWARIGWVLGSAAALVAVAAVLVSKSVLYEVDLVSFLPRTAAVAIAGVVAAARWLSRNKDAETRQLSLRVVTVIGACAVGYAGFAVYAYWDGRAGIDPLLLVVLVAECLALVYIAHRRVEVRILLSRAVTYAILSMAVAVVAALVFGLLGYEVDVVVLTVTVAIALFAAILFMGLGELMSSGFEQLLFPERARLTRALGASRGEIAALKRRLERAEKLAIIGELAASVAHEIKNPLAPIRGYAQLLSDKLGSLSPEERELFERGLGIIQEESDRIDGRVQSLLQLARSERQTASFQESLELNRVVLEAAAVAEGEEGVAEIASDLDPSVGRVVGNEDELRGALLNLLKNAAEAMAGTDGSRIDVRTHREAERVVVLVEDEGPGLPPDGADRIFEAFYTTKEGGTGLGMAIARSAVEAAGGTIRIDPRSGRRGAVVRIELDVAPRVPADDSSRVAAVERDVPASTEGVTP